MGSIDDEIVKNLKIMIDEQNTMQVIRERRHYRPFEARKPRLRSSCPKCGSLDVKKRRDTYNYICGRCGWKGETVAKIKY
jgi:ribosomal protein L37AE/L43A